MLSTPSSSDFFQLLHVFQIQVFPFFFCWCRLQNTSVHFSSPQIIQEHHKHTSILIQIVHNMFWMVLKYVQIILPKKSTWAHVKYMWGGSADVAGTGSRRVIQGWILRGLKHLLYITITDFDHCLHYFSLYCLFFYGKADRSELGALI